MHSHHEHDLPRPLAIIAFICVAVIAGAIGYAAYLDVAAWLKRLFVH